MRVFIIGAGGFGREIAGIYQTEERLPELAFLDDSYNEGRLFTQEGHAIVGAIDFDRKFEDGDVWLCAIGDPHHRERIYTSMHDQQRIVSFRSSHSEIAITARYQLGSIIMPFSLMSNKATAGRGCIINAHSSVGHDASLGEFCTLSSYVDICGNVKVGNRVFFGSGARVMPGLTIGDDAVIGAGAVVMRSVPAGETWAGNPARRIV